MDKFTFLKVTDTIGENEAFKIFATPSPNKDYSLTIKYYRNEKLSEGDYHTIEYPNLFSDVFLYLREKDNGNFAVFKYEGDIWVHRHIDDRISYDDIKNLSEISTDIQNEWDSLVTESTKLNAPE